jgi:hypothetical protein
MDMDVSVLTTHYEDDLSIESLRRDYLKSADEELGMTVHEEGFFLVRDRMLFSSLPGHRKIVAPIQRPQSSNYVYVFLQFRSPLGVNYGRVMEFGWEKARSRYLVIAVRPEWSWTDPVRRVDLYGHPHGTRWFRRPLPKYLRGKDEGFHKLFSKHAIQAARLKGATLGMEERGTVYEIRG